MKDSRDPQAKDMHTTEDPSKENEGNASPPEGTQGTEIPDPIPVSKKEYEALQARLRELEDLKDKLLRSAADFDNAKKRLAREREDFVRFSQENLIKGLLPVLDNFERALGHASQPSEGELKSFLSGIEMVYKQLQDALKGQGLVRLKSVNEIFDPHKHEAVVSTEEEGKDHEVIEELEAGYLLNGRLLRAAKVRIRVAPSGSSKGEAASE
jgi:molecular chaperone GrpE